MIKYFYFINYKRPRQYTDQNIFISSTTRSFRLINLLCYNYHLVLRHRYHEQQIIYLLTKIETICLINLTYKRYRRSESFNTNLQLYDEDAVVRSDPGGSPASPDQLTEEETEKGSS